VKATDYFQKCTAMLDQKLRGQLKEAGKEFSAETQLKELLVESIFDTDQSRETKQLIAEIQQYIEECEFLVKNKYELARAREKKEETIEVPESFSKVPENASEFKTVTIKKRTIKEITPES
jgi:trans-2-enoyl-CoA reductase